MKKLRSNSGYTLAPVMVIMVLVLALTGGAIANSVLNLQAQENAVKQMQGKYTAAGKIEECYTKLKGATFKLDTEENTLNFTIAANVEGEIKKMLVDGSVSDLYLDEELFTVSVSRSDGSATATAEFEVSYTDPSPVNNNGTWTHTITITSVTYKSFDVSYGGTGGGGS